MDSKPHDEFIIDEKAIQDANILDPSYYYYDTFYPAKKEGEMPHNPLFPHLKDLINEYSNKGERLRK